VLAQSLAKDVDPFSESSDGTGRRPNEVTEPADVLAGDSAEQRAAEAVMLDALSRELAIDLAKRRLATKAGAWTEIDGVCESPPVLVEAWAHQGRPKSAQKAKVMTDAAKLVWAEATFYPAGARKILLLSDPIAAGHFRGSSWMAAALVNFGIEVRTVELPSDHLAAVLRAQARQIR
jgi:hypothetical protein